MLVMQRRNRLIAPPHDGGVKSLLMALAADCDWAAPAGEWNRSTHIWCLGTIRFSSFYHDHTIPALVLPTATATAASPSNLSPIVPSHQHYIIGDD